MGRLEVGLDGFIGLSEKWSIDLKKRYCILPGTFNLLLCCTGVPGTPRRPGTPPTTYRRRPKISKNNKKIGIQHRRSGKYTLLRLIRLVQKFSDC